MRRDLRSRFGDRVMETAWRILLASLAKHSNLLHKDSTAGWRVPSPRIATRYHHAGKR
jgi:hypothetical protein